MELFSQPEGSIFSPELELATGYVALEAAQLEDTLGERVVLYAQLARETAGPDGATEPQNQEAAPKGWWTSGEQLLTALRAIGEPSLDALIAGYEQLHGQRNTVVHALPLTMPGTDMDFTTKRVKSTKGDEQPAGYTLAPTSAADRLELAAQFRQLDSLASDAVTAVMGSCLL